MASPGDPFAGFGKSCGVTPQRLPCLVISSVPLATQQHVTDTAKNGGRQWLDGIAYRRLFSLWAGAVPGKQPGLGIK